jgi:iron complex outermembrane receptor protein
MKEGSMKKRKVFLIGICFIVLMCFGAAWAEEPAQTTKDYQVFDLGEIFVTSEKPPAVQEVSLTYDVTPEFIDETNSLTVAEALTYVPGIRVSGGRKNEPSIQIHGMAQDKILVLIDGVPYYETKYGSLDMNQIPIDNIAKIEIIKDAPSVLYGTNALIGVVNIITKKGTEKLAAQATVEMGPHKFNRESVSHGWKVGMFNYWLNYSHRQTDGWRLSDDFDPVSGIVRYRPNDPVYGQWRSTILEDGGYRTNSDYNQHSVWAKVGIDPSPGSEYFVNAHYITKEKGDPPNIYGGARYRPAPFDYFYGQHFWGAGFLPAFSQVFDRITEYEDWGIDFSGQQKIFDPFTIKGKVFYHHHFDQYTSYSDLDYDREIAVSDYKDYIIGGYLIGDVRPIEWDAIRFSFHYKGDDHKERADDYLPFEDYFSTTGSVGLENEFNLIKGLSLVIGASYDWFNVTKAKANNVDSATGNLINQYKIGTPDLMDEFCPMVGATYTFPSNTRLFGSVARKTRFPRLSQIYGSSGNLNLKAEKAINYTLGVSHSFSKYVSAELAGFYHDLSDFISRDTPDPSGLYFNHDKIHIAGAELIGKFYPLRDFALREDLNLWAGYTYLRAQDKSPDAVTSKVRNVPKNKVDMGFHLTVPYIKTGLDMVGIYMGEVYSYLPTITYPTDPTIKTKSFFTMNARISQTFLKYFEAYVAINNIFDRNYEVELGYPAPGRSFYAGLTARY